MRSRIGNERTERGANGRPERNAGGAWIALLAVWLLAFCGQRGAEAQLAGSVQIGQSRSTTTSTDGQIDSRSQGGSLDILFGRGAGRAASWRSPYGRLNYGRAPVSGDGLDGFFGGGFLDGGFLDGGLHSSQWTGLIEQNFRIMRRTSPFPDRFAGGIYNPRPFSHRFGGARYGFFYPTFGNFSYGGYAFSYGAPIYGDYVPSVYSLYGPWYPPYLPLDRVYIIEREVPKARAEPDSSRQEPEKPGESEKRSSSDDSDYYLSPHSGETPEDAMADIRHAWMNGEFTRLKSRIPGKGRVRIYLKGKYKYSVDAGDFEQMTQDAMKRIDTTAFTLDHVKRLSDDRAFASGKHVYYDPEREKHEVYVSYGLAREEGRWRIVEAGSSTEPIAAHSD